MYVVRDAYVEGIRNGDMADHGVIVAMVRRYGIRVLVWNVPPLEAIEALGSRSRSYRVHEIAPPGVGTRSPTLYVLHTYIGYEHFEPILPVEGTTPRPGRFTAVGDRPESEGYCPILALQYTSNAQRQRVSTRSTLGKNVCITWLRVQYRCFVQFLATIFPSSSEFTCMLLRRN